MTRTNQTEETHDTTKHLHNENLHEQVRIRSVCERGSRSGNTDRDTAKQVARADSETAPEERVPWVYKLKEALPLCHEGRRTCEVVLARVEKWVAHRGNACRVHDANDLRARSSSCSRSQGHIDVRLHR